MIYIKVRINDAKITYQNPLKKNSSKYQIVIKFTDITAIHCNINDFNFFLSSFISRSFSQICHIFLKNDYSLHNILFCNLHNLIKFFT